MSGFRLREVIERSPDAIFAYVTDFDNAEKWMPGVVRIDKISKGPVKVGTRFAEARPIRGVETRLEMEVAVFDAPLTYATVFERAGYRVEYRYTFEADGDGTRIELRGVVTARGLNKLKLPLVVWAIKNQDKGQLASLKEAMESGG